MVRSKELATVAAGLAMITASEAPNAQAASVQSSMAALAQQIELGGVPSGTPNFTPPPLQVPDTSQQLTYRVKSSSVNSAGMPDPANVKYINVEVQQLSPNGKLQPQVPLCNFTIWQNKLGNIVASQEVEVDQSETRSKPETYRSEKQVKNIIRLAGTAIKIARSGGVVLYDGHKFIPD